MKRALASLATAVIMLAGSANAGELVIIFDDLNPGPKAAFEKVVADFDAANPDITVNLSINDREAHKTAVLCASRSLMLRLTVMSGLAASKSATTFSNAALGPGFRSSKMMTSSPALAEPASIMTAVASDARARFMLSSQQSLLKLLQQERCIVTSETVDQPVAGSTVYFFEKEAGHATGKSRWQIPHSCRGPANDAPSKDRGRGIPDQAATGPVSVPTGRRPA